MLSMAPGPVILDISSDEEEETGVPWDKKSRDLISYLLEGPDEAPSDPDTVVVLDELSCAAAAAPKPGILTTTAKVDSGDVSDDDCMILEGDPDKLVAVVHNKEHDADELLIVGEKGDLACRDYPHPRHLCATFPFRSTPHNRHCNQCHCYVCDVVAPCAHWGNGTFTTDHCHSTDKEELWKMLRKSWKDGTAATASNLSNLTSIVDALAPLNHMSSATTSGYNPMLPPLRQVMTGALQACSKSTFQGPSLTSQIENQQLVDGRVLYQFHQLVSARNAVPASQGAGMQSARPALTNPSVSSPRASVIPSSVSREGRVAANQYQFHRPIYRPHQSGEVVEPRRFRYPPVQGQWRNQHSTNLESRKHHQSTVQDPLKYRAEPVFKRLRIKHLPDAHSEMPPLDADGLKRLNDIMSCLESEIGGSNANHTDSSTTVFSPSGILHPHVAVVSEQSAEVLVGSEGRVAPLPPLHDTYNPSYPSIGSSPSGSNFWNSNPAMTNTSSSGFDVCTASNQSQNYEEQFLAESRTRSGETTSLPSLSKEFGLGIAAAYTSNQWVSFAATSPP